MASKKAERKKSAEATESAGIHKFITSDYKKV
jgi:hypothetical protein